MNRYPNAIDRKAIEVSEALVNLGYTVHVKRARGTASTYLRVKGLTVRISEHPAARRRRSSLTVDATHFGPWRES